MALPLTLFDFQFRVPSDEDPEPFARILSTPTLVKLAAMLPRLRRKNMPRSCPFRVGQTIGCSFSKP